MPETNWPDIIEESRNGNNALFNKAVSDNYPIHFKGALITLTGSEEMAWEIYLNGMTKFWERFVLHSESLPDKNVKGYIFRMLRNNYVDEKRKLNRKKSLNYVELDQRKLVHQYTNRIMVNENITEHDFQNNQELEQKYLVALENAISRLSDDCKKLIERNVFEGEKLKVLKSEFGYTGSYQAIVEKKKRCIRKITKLFFEELSEMNIEIS